MKPSIPFLSLWPTVSVDHPFLAILSWATYFLSSLMIPHTSLQVTLAFKKLTFGFPHSESRAFSCLISIRVIHNLTPPNSPKGSFQNANVMISFTACWLPSSWVESILFHGLVLCVFWLWLTSCHVPLYALSVLSSSHVATSSCHAVTSHKACAHVVSTP